VAKTIEQPPEFLALEGAAPAGKHPSPNDADIQPASGHT
jgi:hypothetical protein